MQRYFLHLAYKGTNFFGWQIQPDHRSVQEVIEKALSELHSKQKVRITGCGRTDTGVHATNYFAHFDSKLKLGSTDIIHKLNGMIGPDIVIKNMIKVGPEAHARFDACSRTYHYFIHQSKDPFIQETSWFNKQELDIDKMNKACLFIQDHKDFECFSKVKTEVDNFSCDIKHALWIRSEKGLIFTITANRFLRNMVRAIVGTMIDIGSGKTNLDDLKQILKSKNRSEAGQSVPAHGLFLADVGYDYIQKEEAQIDLKIHNS